MKNLVKIDLRTKSHWNKTSRNYETLTPVNLKKFLETVGEGNQESYLNEDYYRRFEENKFIDLSDNMLYMEYEYLCVWNENKLWGKLKKELGDGYTINWETYPLWGSRKARIVDLLLDD